MLRWKKGTEHNVLGMGLPAKGTERYSRMVASAGLWLAPLLHVASFWLMLEEVEPFHTGFYSLAWWSYIVFVSAINQRWRGTHCCSTGGGSSSGCSSCRRRPGCSSSSATSAFKAGTTLEFPVSGGCGFRDISSPSVRFCPVFSKPERCFRIWGSDSDPGRLGQLFPQAARES